MNKKYFVLGIKELPTRDTSSEADNPYLFYDLELAMKFAKEVVKEEEFAKVVEIVDVWEFRQVNEEYEKRLYRNF